MSMNKIQDVKLETTATYQPLSDLNVRFWSQDKNTAELRFIITRNKFPLSLSKENVKVIIALESGASFISSDDFIIDSEVEGVARYIIPTDFMRVASNVTGQVYVTTLDREEIIVERQFKFTVSNDLLSDYPSEDKLRYIKTFDDLRTEISSRVSKLESDMETMEDYVTKVQDTTQEGITALSTLIQQKQDAYNANHTAKMKELNDKGTEYSTKFDSDKQYIDEKTEAFRESVAGSGLVTTGESANWQKYKLTDDSGVLPIVNLNGDLAALQALPSGFYYRSFVPISGMGQTSSSGYVTVWESNGGQVKHISFKPYNSSQEFIMRYYREWSGWENKFDGLEKSIDAQSKANVAENNAKEYTDSIVNSQHAVLFNGTVNGVGSKINLTDSLYNYNQIVISGEAPGGVFNEVVLPATIKSNIMIQRLNLRDSDGNFLGIYEVKLDVINGTTLTIANDVSWDVSSSSGSGPGRNAFTIQRIEGFNSSKIGKGLTPLGSDIYSTMTQLMSLTDEGTDWQIETNNVDNSNTIVTAIHGGGIEPGTTELAKLTSEIANQTYYSFMGIRSSGNSDLHVTSTRFNEPTLEGMMNVPYGVFIHGVSGNSKEVLVGGLDTNNRDIMIDKITQAGFTASVATGSIAGTDSDNIANKTSRSKGVQLELTTALRKSLFVNDDWSRSSREDRSKWSPDMTNLATAISDAIKEFTN